jgi:hypothetical protein
MFHVEHLQCARFTEAVQNQVGLHRRHHDLPSQGTEDLSQPSPPLCIELRRKIVHEHHAGAAPALREQPVLCHEQGTGEDLLLPAGEHVGGAPPICLQSELGPLRDLRA